MNPKHIAELNKRIPSIDLSIEGTQNPDMLPNDEFKELYNSFIGVSTGGDSDDERIQSE